MEACVGRNGVPSVLSKIVPESLAGLRRVYSAATGKPTHDPALLPRDFEGQDASDYIRGLVERDAPCLICRFGAFELGAVRIHYHRQEQGGFFRKSSRYIRGEIGPFLWDRSVRYRMSNNAGFSPASRAGLERFGQQMLADMEQIDVLGSWLAEEALFRCRYPEAKIVPLRDLEPFQNPRPWSAGLSGQRVLVVHPFEQSIRTQYSKRRVLFEDPDTLPDFDLKTIKAVQSSVQIPSEYSDWFDAFESMCDEIEKTEFDVAIIGAGAYGMPLASFVKRIGKKAVHLGGASQLLFGIKGKRWDDRGMYNEHWTRPLAAEVPRNAQKVEGGCYW